MDNGGCEHYCTETVHSYYCSCYPGYTLQEDGHNCTGEMFNIITFFSCFFEAIEILYRIFSDDS